ncbi:MAG TPA: adenylate/guanylate cyclase domain-containing protein [Kofleriaceae bacterium]|nr:adenylate/guanylate cyclase domain-containing protein [Kofleriaceae bacterium]
MSGRVRRLWSRRNAPLLAAVIATALAAALHAAHLARIVTMPGIDGWEDSLENARVRIGGTRAPADDRIVIVALDDATRRSRPQVFQTRRGLAELFDAIAAARPRVIGLDLFFAQDELQLDREVLALVKAALARVSAEAPPPGSALASAREALDAVVDETRGDERLAETIARARGVYLGFLFLFEGAAAAGAPELPGLARARLAEVVTAARSAGRHPQRAGGVIASLEKFARGAAGGGFVNVDPDPDGTVRRLPLVVEHGGRYYMALGLAVALAAQGADAGYVTGEDALRFGDQEVPVDRRGRATLSYLGPSESFPHISAADVLSSPEVRARLRDRIVLVGYTDAARDKIAQPFDRVMSGVEVHATLVHNLLHGELLRHVEPATAIGLVAALCGALCLLQVRRVRQRGAWVVGAGTAVAIAAYLVASQVLLQAEGVVIPVVAPVLAAALVTAAALSVGLATEGREKARLRSAFSRYVPGSVVERILADPSRIRLGGDRRVLTVLFCDIRGFSRTAENLEPEVLSEYLNEYLTPMSNLVLDGGGMLDKYIGDAIMAVYGAPLEVPDHAARACECALAMLRALGPINAEFTRRSLPPVAVGIGLSTGPMSVGNMGSQARFDFTVLGDAVNLGARLEALTRDYKVDILCADETARAAGERFVFRELDVVRVKGRAGVGRIHQLCGERGAPGVPGAEELARFAAGLEHYRARRWADARAAFDQLPRDGPTEVLLARIADLEAHPPPPAWDGVFDQLVK